ncbi:membrane-spanning 4-domains subfamily A member 4A-like [Crotalus tigris]|uniref:membrane-spanning 4-domains subfamily A member 4A-like n=1 Tax=Crotalus tigris TaxID=88082 RepID=UPI00192F6EB9|nr:membrane-spanning 4-domains subfamily A member 4A-like [Crotalus tigris]XP_039181760.1 membrane-spanning 4-domains subfamily A member 4A-like [Crotalus tigris]
MHAPLVPGSLPSTTQTDLPVPLKKFYQGEPLALGIIQIFIGIIGMIFGILLDIMNDFFMIYTIIKIAYWSGILYIISGSLAVAAARNPKIPLVQGALAMNVISAVSAGIGIIFLSSSITTHFSYHFWHFCNEFEHSYEGKCYETLNIINGILAVLIMFTILEFCITISVASFGCKMLCQNTFTETVVVIYQNVTPASVEHPPIDCKQPEFP